MQAFSPSTIHSYQQMLQAQTTWNLGPQPGPPQNPAAYLGSRPQMTGLLTNPIAPVPQYAVRNPYK